MQYPSTVPSSTAGVNSNQIDLLGDGIEDLLPGASLNSGPPPQSQSLGEFPSLVFVERFIS